MKKIFTYLILALIVCPVFGQYYLRGEIKDEKNKPLPNARIFVHSLKAYYYSGAGSGSFGITVRNLYDTLTITLDGYETAKITVRTDVWQKITLKPTEETVSKSQLKLISATKDFNQYTSKNWVAGDETYFQLVENDFIKANLYPSTGFSLNVNKASYSNVRRFLNMGSLVPPDAVRTEELVNYFNLNYKEPGGDEIFNVQSQLTSCPWNIQNELLYLNISAKKIDFEKVPPGNFVFLIDVSGSMDMPNRLPLIKAAFQLFVKNLRPIDTVSIVTYGGYVQVWLQPTSGVQKEKIIRSIEELVAQGDTPGESAIRAAYQVARHTFIKGGNNRIILATDGDFNVGETSEKALDELITKQRESGVYLTCLGVGMGNFKDSKLQTLAKKGNGNYAYLDDISEAERVLVKELTQTFYAVADDVFMNVKFNPDYVKDYRLVGFDNKKEALSDTSSKLEGGEIGSGSNIMAIFEILPTENKTAFINQLSNKNIAELFLTYKVSQQKTEKEKTYHAVYNFLPFENVDMSYRFAAAVSMFAMKLKLSKFAGDKDWGFISNLARSSASPDNYLQNEFINLVGKAEKLYAPEKKKKNKKED